jgi:SnoaL-like protein
MAKAQLRAGGLLAAVLVLAWWLWPSSEADAVRQRLDALLTLVNTTTSDGLNHVVRAAEIGSYFTDDVLVDLGQGTAPIQGRETLVGMAARLQTPTSAFRLQFDDVGVEVANGEQAADVSLTASFIRRSTAAGEDAMDAREFALALKRVDGVWQIARVTTVDALR